jgi:hypothetical protein
MKHKLLIQSGITLAVLFVLAFGVSVKQAYATTGCFADTVGNWAETFICWMKDNGITGGVTPTTYAPNANVTRAEMAVFLQRQAEVPPTTGRILISAGMGDWKPFLSTDTLVFGYFSDTTGVFNPSTGNAFLSVHPDLPTVLYGRSLRFSGVEFCYGASVDTVLNYVEINTYTHTSGPGTKTTRLTDNTARTDTACRLYTLTTPVTLTAEDGINLFIQVNWVTAAAEFSIGRTTFILEPTGILGAAPSALETLGTNPETPLNTTDPSKP